LTNTNIYFISLIRRYSKSLNAYTAPYLSISTVIIESHDSRMITCLPGEKALVIRLPVERINNDI